jgi:antitoxin component HigA of HigAB toxin-antitoxin module
MLSSVLKKAGATNIVPIKNQREYRRALKQIKDLMMANPER